MPCAHLAPPQPAALEVLRDPTRWRCLACGSTDGVWCCLTCGHVGCGRNARHPELGGGHALSHHHVCGTHTVVLDVLSGAAYCYMCERDDPLSQGWVLEDPPWLGKLRGEIAAAASEPPDADSGDADSVSADTKGDADDSPPPSSKKREQRPTAGRAGLRNLGNSCYMNSVLQLLSSVRGFRSFFRDFLRAQAPVQLGSAMLQRRPTEVWKASAEASGAPPSLELTEAIHALTRVLCSGRYAVCSPHRFVRAVWKHAAARGFATRRQCDAQEFLTFLLDGLASELGPGEGSGRAGPDTPRGVIEDLFSVCTTTTTWCATCGEASRRNERSIGLVITLPDGAPAPVDLLSALGDYFTAETLSGADAYACGRCKATREATRACHVTAWPPALLLAVRRTRWSARLGMHKDARDVAPPLRFGTGALGSPIAQGGEQPGGAAGGAPGASYRLTAAVCHAGATTECGHYYCLARADGAAADAADVSADGAAEGNGAAPSATGAAKGAIAGAAKGGKRRQVDVVGASWLMINDERISGASEEQLRSCDAYILAYELDAGPSMNPPSAAPPGGVASERLMPPPPRAGGVATSTSVLMSSERAAVRASSPDAKRVAGASPDAKRRRCTRGREA